MKGCPVFFDLLLSSYKSKKSRKKREFFYENFWKMDKKCIFSSFVPLVITQRKIVENWATSHFAPNFVLFDMALSEISFHNGFEDLKNRPFSI